MKHIWHVVNMKRIWHVVNMKRIWHVLQMTGPRWELAIVWGPLGYVTPKATRTALTCVPQPRARQMPLEVALPYPAQSSTLVRNKEYYGRLRSAKVKAKRVKQRKSS